MNGILLFIFIAILATGWALIYFEMKNAKEELESDESLKKWYSPILNRWVMVEVFRNELHFYIIKQTTNNDFGYRAQLGMWLNGEWFFADQENDEIGKQRTRAFVTIQKRYSDRISKLQQLSKVIN